uniref:Uncharacterized protein n=1 Tax=Sus scrofa TaxID=9823 RepID=A0A4X1SH30_PIG
MGTLGQCVRKARVVSPLARVQSRQNLMVPEPRSLSLFTKKPPRNVPPPPAGTTRYPARPPPSVTAELRAWRQAFTSARPWDEHKGSRGPHSG